MYFTYVVIRMCDAFIGQDYQRTIFKYEPRIIYTSRQLHK